MPDTYETTSGRDTQDRPSGRADAVWDASLAAAAVSASTVSDKTEIKKRLRAVQVHTNGIALVPLIIVD